MQVAVSDSITPAKPHLRSHHLGEHPPVPGLGREPVRGVSDEPHLADSTQRACCVCALDRCPSPGIARKRAHPHHPSVPVGPLPPNSYSLQALPLTDGTDEPRTAFLNLLTALIATRPTSQDGTSMSTSNSSSAGQPGAGTWVIEAMAKLAVIVAGPVTSVSTQTWRRRQAPVSRPRSRPGTRTASAAGSCRPGRSGDCRSSVGIAPMPHHWPRCRHRWPQPSPD